MKTNILVIFTMLTSMTSAMALTACSQDTPPAQTTNIAVSAPAFTASGSEPFWDMRWDGDAMLIQIGIDKQQTRLNDITVTKIAKGLQMTSNSGASITLIQNQCLDLAGNSHDFEINAAISGRRLVGCGDKTP